MAKKTGFMEWLHQTRRINKNVDQICMDTIDSIVGIKGIKPSMLPHIDRKVIYRNNAFFDRFCPVYNKPHPRRILRRIPKKHHKKNCMEELLGIFIQSSIDRCWNGIEMVRTQWDEIVDFMYDYPNLVNPSVVDDDYVSNKIAEVCAGNRKNNPLKNGTARMFGKKWKDADGNIHAEKRRRF